MLLGFVLIFSLHTSTVNSLSSTPSRTADYPMTRTTTAGPTTTEKLGPLYLVAIPDYPVAAGQTVQLYCNTFTSPKNITWSRYCLQNQSWENVTSGPVLTLTEPKESGKYRCETRTGLNMKIVSRNHTVFIVSVPTTGEMLGIAAFALSVLILIAIVAGLLWLCWQKFVDKLSALNAPKKDVSAPPEVIPKVLPANYDPDGDVYMNYTSTTPAYTDLNPSNMTGDELYSSLS